MLKTGPFVFRLFSVLMLLTLLVSAPGVTPAHAAGIRYATAGGTGDCSSWANACTLRIALTGATSGDEIWAAAGTHTPGTARTDTFQLKSGVAVYGGFAGMETLRSGRNPNPATNATLLSGEIGVAGNSDNSYHVVTGATGATLDGFTITAGNANSGTYPNLLSCGGGMLNDSNSPTVTNVTFSSNYAISYGGGMANQSSSPVLINVTFDTNTAGNAAGGMANLYSYPALENVTFNNNSAGSYAGGMGNDHSAPKMANVTFNNNTAGVYAGGMGNSYSSPVEAWTNLTFSNNSSGSYGGGMGNEFSSPTLTNVTFSNNSAGSLYGGGMANDNSSPTLMNVTFKGNAARTTGGGMANGPSSNPQIQNTIFWGNTAHTGGEQIINDDTATPVISSSVFQGGCPDGSTCTTIISSDPRLGTLGDYGGFTQTIPLLEGSSAIDTGNNATCPTTDQRGIARPQGTGCDIGAYEYVVPTPPSISFTDVPATYWAVTWIERLANAGITSGCSTNPMMYCPEDLVTRAQMAIFLERGMNGSDYTPPAATGTVFGDVLTSTWAANWIEKLYADGITNGCVLSPLAYCPEDPVTRAQMAIFLLRAEHGAAYIPPGVGSSTGFNDVPVTHWAAAWIKQLAAEGITTGCVEGNYCPEDSVTRAQMAVFLVRTFNLP